MPLQRNTDNCCLCHVGLSESYKVIAGLFTEGMCLDSRDGGWSSKGSNVVSFANDDQHPNVQTRFGSTVERFGTFTLIADRCSCILAEMFTLKFVLATNVKLISPWINLLHMPSQYLGFPYLHYTKLTLDFGSTPVLLHGDYQLEHYYFGVGGILRLLHWMYTYTCISEHLYSMF